MNLLRYWRIIAGLIALAGAGLAVNAWANRCEQRGYDKAVSEYRAQMDAQRIAADSRLRLLQEKVYANSDQYQRSLADIRAREPARAVRLFIPAPSLPSDRDPSAISGPDAAAKSGLAGTAGSDIGPSLYRIADDGDENAAQVIALQAYVRLCAKTP